MNKLFTAQEVADRLQIKKTTVYELIKRGELESSKIGKQLRISEEQLSQYINKNSSNPSVWGVSSSSSLNTNSDKSTAPTYSAAGFQPESSLLKRDYLLHSSGIILSGQTSSAIELLLGKMSAHPNGLPVLQSHMNDYNGLYALYFGKAHIAAVSLEADDITSLVPGMPLVLLSLYKYETGFYVQSGNLKKITSIQDLTRTGIRFLNRERGSSRRIYLDRIFKENKVPPQRISSCKNEAVSDMSAASAVSENKADAAFGEKMIARYFPGLDFVPLTTMHMYLAIPEESIQNPGFSALIDIVQSEDFKLEIHNLTGYDTSCAGKLISI